MIANALSATRILLALAVLWLGLAIGDADGYALAAALFVAGIGTDVADGALARRRGPTMAGTILDPAADGALILCALLPVALRIEWTAPVFALLLVRDALILDLRIRLASHGIALPAVPASKAKTAFLDVGCVGILAAMATGGSLFLALGYACVAAGTFLSVTSALHYAGRARTLRA